MSNGILFIVATPIGNLQDITLRAIETLKHVNLVACEDTRVTKKLLGHFDIHVPCVRLDAHASTREYAKILADLTAGKNIALVTDAGTPGISDPGAQLVAYVVKHAPEISVTPIPGPSALAAALSISGFSFASFTFVGFPPAKKGRTSYFKYIAETTDVIVFYESVHRIKRTLQELGEVIGDRPIVVCRELTKQFETVYRGTISEILSRAVEERGEFVIVVAPRPS